MVPLSITDKTELEFIVDRCSLARVLEALAEICSEKADHIRTNWQDHATARPWDAAERKLSHIKVEV